tara:strand:+ start:209 stop:616 length:408 start_codon:yes stop_codon:yes gene_type:complete
MDFNVRALTTKDWDTLVEWWDWWPGWTAPPKDFLPNHGTGGFMVEKTNKPIVAGFVYFTNSKIAWVEYIISNPDYKEDDRQDAIKKLLTELEEFITTMGYKYMFSVVQNKHLIEIHKNLDWNIDEKPSYELSKNL